MNLYRGLKVHLRVVEIHGTTLRVVTLRPQTSVVFATNYFHDTWHVLSDGNGAAVLGRLLYGLAFQRQPGTLVMIAPPHLVPTPFEGDPSDPILLVPDGLTSIDADLLRALKLRLRRAPSSPTTIRWHTFGMPAAIEADRDRWRTHAENDAVLTREKMSRRAGFLCYTAPRPVLIESALSIYACRDDSDSSYVPLASDQFFWHMDGEFQTIMRMRDKVSAATVARRELVGDQSTLTENERHAVWSRTFRVLDRLTEAKRSR